MSRIARMLAIVAILMVAFVGTTSHPAEAQRGPTQERMRELALTAEDIGPWAFVASDYWDVRANTFFQRNIIQSADFTEGVAIAYQWSTTSTSNVVLQLIGNMRRTPEGRFISFSPLGSFTGFGLYDQPKYSVGVGVIGGNQAILVVTAWFSAPYIVSMIVATTDTDPFYAVPTLISYIEAQRDKLKYGLAVSWGY